MCGIAGMVGAGLEPATVKEVAQRLLAALRHRGPDDEGFEFTRDGMALLVHTRLAILDPGPSARQPMARGRCRLVFNGEIYNHAALREELAREGEVFDSSGDTEVLLALLRRTGPSAVTRLGGMFAFALWDADNQTCLLARDSFGIKPLYYAELPGGGLVFASELRALLATGLVERRIDTNGLDHYLATGSVTEPATLVRGVRLLPSGHWLRWQQGRTELSRYFTPDFAPHDRDGTTTTERARAALEESVRRHLVSDVPVGIFLSGGLDSGALLAAARPHADTVTFAIGCEDKQLDESDAARRLASHFGTRHHELLLTSELARHWRESFLESLDQPTVDGFNTFTAARLAADHGCKVVLSGIGGDEFFGGYPSFQTIPKLIRVVRALRPLRGLAHCLEPLLPSPRYRRLAEGCANHPGYAEAYAIQRGLFTAHEREAIRCGWLTEVEPSRAPVEPHVPLDGLAPGDAVSVLEITRYLRNQLLRDADVLAMRHGVELRTPLVDRDLFATLRTIPAARRLEAGKRLLRDAVPGLPRWHAAGPKRGFTLPWTRWLAEDGPEIEADLPRVRGLRPVTWSRRWSLIVLHRWLKRHRMEGLAA